MKLSEELAWRGFNNQTTLTDLAQLDKDKWIFYHGYDASVDSLTVGNLAAVMLDKLFLRHGSKAILLAGGATSLIGDPGGKDSERVLQDEQTISRNVRKVKQQIESLVASEVHMVNNLDWFKSMDVLEFLRDVGKHFSMTPLVQRDYIANRMGEKGSGISYTEFSYTLLQGYDFLHLYQKYGVELQLAGSDQWGNAISGIELVRRVEGKEVHALTMPLIINKSTGKKFGKSEEGAIWLDADKTSPYRFYQFWLNIGDEGVEDYLKIYTELDKKQIDKIMEEFKEDPSKRYAQRRLAQEVTHLVHGAERLERVEKITEAIFQQSNLDVLSHHEIEDMKKELPFLEVHSGADIVTEIVSLGLASSKTEARNFVQQGGISINGIKLPPTTQELLETDFVHHIGDQSAPHFALVKRGKNKIGLLIKK